jgi:hypothetical protein
MKKDLLTVKELAAELRMSPKSIQRAYRKEEIPVQWLGRMARFNLANGVSTSLSFIHHAMDGQDCDSSRRWC